MSDQTLSLSEKLRVWKASGMAITLQPDAVAQMADNLDAVVRDCADTLMEAIKTHRRERRLLWANSTLMAFNLIAALIWWLG